MRFAIDYRLLNDITKKDAYPIPDIQTILDKLEGSDYYSFIDVASAYWCVPVRKGDIEKTAFSTHRGQFEMLVMPFGLCNAPGTYQRIMDQALAKATNTESYIDDCLVYSKGFRKHLSDLRTAFQGLKSANIQLRIEKCSFGYWEGKFLGHLLTRNGHQPNPDLVVKIRNFPPPTTTKELQRFLGTANYYRSYIRNMAAIAEPLNKLTRKDTPWNWTVDCQLAFDTLRETLSTEPVVLRYPRWGQPFIVEADASSIAIAAVLSQHDPTTGILQPISYFSSALNDTQMKYSAGQKEAWAIVAATRKWYDYLKGAVGAILLTDHNPLAWLRRQPDPRHTFARWVMELEGLDYHIRYRRGRDNCVADCLSRPSGAITETDYDKEVNEENLFEDLIYVVASARGWVEKVKDAQNSDDALAFAKTQLSQTGEVTAGQYRKVLDLQLRDDFVCKGTKIVAPKALRREIMEKAHITGHFGGEKTGELIARNYFWIGMSEDINKHCKCARFALRPNRTFGLGNPWS